MRYFALIVVLTAALTSGCASVTPADCGAENTQHPIATNTRTYCRGDIERTGQQDVASAVSRSASSARKC